MQESPAQIATTTAETATPLPKQRRGFAMMDPDTLRAVCSQGGQTAHALGRAHRFNTEKASQAGKKGGATVSADRSHMAEIGSRGGKAKKGFRERQAARCQAEAEQPPSA
jgi:general stress protein YciG